MKKILLAATLSTLAFSAMAFDTEFHLVTSTTKEQYNCNGNINVLNDAGDGLDSYQIDGALLTLNTNEKEYSKELTAWAVENFGVTEADAAVLKGVADFQLNETVALSGAVFEKTFAELKAANEDAIVYVLGGTDNGNAYAASFGPYGISLALVVTPNATGADLQVVGIDQSNNGYDLGKFSCTKK